MINLLIEEYCNNCPGFEVEQNTLAAATIDGEIVNREHYIKCVNRDKCNNIKKHLQKFAFLPDKDTVSDLKKEIESLTYRISHLLKSDTIREFDAKDRRTGQYKKDVTKFDEEFKKYKEAYEKQTPINPYYEGDGYDEDGNFIYDYAKCPVCGRDFEEDINNDWGCAYCQDCGQALKW